MTPGIRTAWSRHGTNAVRYSAAMTLIAGAALFAFQTPAQAQSGATDPDVGTPVSTSPVGTTPLDLGGAGLTTDSGKISVPSAGGSGGSSATGDWSATDLSNAGSWSQGGSTGGFNYSYGIELPPAEGPVPSVGLSYSSQAVDGHTSSSNNQAGLIGDGWSYTPGYVERTYVDCMSDDDGGNTPEATADRCWDGKSPSVTLVLEGVNSTLVLDDDTNTWTASADPGWKVELLGSAATPSAATSERWRVTTTDGTVYDFGARAAETGSRLTVPVFGNHSGESCYKADDFAGSDCAQAYRWMVDQITDVHDNRTRFQWATETGHYGAAVDENNRVAFHRSARLTRIDYGLRAAPAADSGVQAGRVTFNYSDRCDSDCYNTDSTPKAASWPETPWDKNCATAPCKDLFSPAFFSSKRLASIETSVPNGSGGFTKIDSWALTQQFLDYGNVEDTVLWLKSIQHTGHVGGTETTPPVTFNGIAFPNRVEHSEGTPSMWRTRLTAITSETGGVTGVWYSAPSCTWDALPDKLNNSSLCYPVLSEEGETEEWFHKYVVTEVAEFDTTGGQVPLRTYFSYSTLGGGTTRLWAWDDSEHTDDKLRTYNQWRGYTEVTTKTGDPTEGPQLTSRTRYHRGMNGQPTTATGTGSLTVVLTDSEGKTVSDHEALTGAVFESASYDGDRIISATVSHYWTKLAAERTYDGGSWKAWYTGQSGSDTRTLLDTATSTWQRTQTNTTFDERGRVKTVSDEGDLGVSDDQRCSKTTYADNASANLYGVVRRAEVLAVACEATPSYPADLISDTKFFYDHDTTGTAAPTDGLLTSTQIVKDHNGTSPTWVETMSATYDGLGRVLTTSDALDRTTTTTYAPTNGGVVTSVTTANALNHTSTVHTDKARGLPVKTVDANNRVTETTYDALGRITAAWGPGWSKTSNPNLPTVAYDYTVSNTAPSSVTTFAITPNTTQRTDSVVLYDSLLREVQAQAPTPQGGRLITGIEYDTRGLTMWASGPNWDSENDPGSDLVYVAQGEDQARTFYSYDDAGRVVLEEFMSHQEILHATETIYGGSNKGWMVSVNPPDGATPTATITNAQGELIEKHDFHGNAPTGESDTTLYDYDHRGNLAKVTDPAGNDWSYTYDLRGRQISATDPDTGTTTAVYDDAGQLIQTLDERDQMLTTTYDALGRRYNLYAGDTNGTRLNAWRYDSVAGGKGLPYLSVSYIDGKAVTTEVRQYDSAGRPTSVTQWIPEIAGFTSLDGSYNIQQDYRVDGSPAITRFPQVSGIGAESVAYHYNDLGQVTRVNGNFNDGTTPSIDYVSSATYTAFGELAQRVLGSNSGQKTYQTWAFEDGTRRLERQRLSRDSTSAPVVADLSYEYDDAGRILSIADSATDAPSEPERQCFVYDYLQRLTEAWAQAGTGACVAESDLDAGDLGGPGAYWTSYDYDVTGNRTAVTEHSASGASTTATYAYTADEAHLVDKVTVGQTVNDYNWDASGNLTERTVNGKKETLTWNAAGKLTSISSTEDGTTRMLYDGANNRVGRIDADGTQSLFVGGQEIVVDPQGVVHATRTYSHNGEMIATRSTDTGLTWIGTTHMGTASWAISAATMVLTYRRQDPFGNNRGEAVNWTATQQGFHTGTEDPTGLVSMGARFYDPTTGRFISRDPVAAFTDSQQINGYAYAHNNPVNSSDPTGLFDCDWQCQQQYEQSRANCNCYMPEDVRESGGELPGEEGYGDDQPRQTTPDGEPFWTDEYFADLLIDLDIPAIVESVELWFDLMGMTPVGWSVSDKGVGHAYWCLDDAFDCPRAFAITDSALQEVNAKIEELAAEGIILTPGEQNALRHSYWMASLTIAGMSYDSAILLGVGHELDGTTPRESWGDPDSLIDLINNDVGARLGVDLRGSMTGFSGLNFSPGDEKEEAMDALVDMVVNGTCDDGFSEHRCLNETSYAG